MMGKGRAIEVYVKLLILIHDLVTLLKINCEFTISAMVDRPQLSRALLKQAETCTAHTGLYCQHASCNITSVVFTFIYCSKPTNHLLLERCGLIDNESNVFVSMYFYLVHEEFLRPRGREECPVLHWK
jgi:hypothetical protein